MIEQLKEQGVNAVFHYVPLHSSVAGLKFARVHGGMEVTDGVSDRLLRLPLWVGMMPEQIQQVVAGVYNILGDEPNNA